MFVKGIDLSPINIQMKRAATHAVGSVSYVAEATMPLEYMMQPHKAGGPVLFHLAPESSTSIFHLMGDSRGNHRPDMLIREGPPTLPDQNQPILEGDPDDEALVDQPLDFSNEKDPRVIQLKLLKREMRESLKKRSWPISSSQLSKMLNGKKWI